MRFKEFFILKEQATQFYAIGDSHADMIARMGGKDWVNLAIGGTSSTDSRMLGNISKIPKGATVLVSQGANDTANAMLRANQTKKPPRNPNEIAANVANVVDKVEAQGAKVIFMLFPNGPGRGKSKDAQWYGGSDYQDKVRDAIKSSINVPIIDINGKPLYDGIHAGNATYKEVADQVRAKAGAGVTLGPAGATPGNVPTKDKGQAAQPNTFSIDVPNGRRGPAVADVQKALVALGYLLPKHGVDGIRGPETIAAVKQFQQANNLVVDGDPGPETVAKLNAVLKTKPEVASKLTKSTTADVKPTQKNTDVKPTQKNTDVKPAQKTSDGGDAKGNGDAIEALMFFISKGWTGTQAAGIVGNLQAESGVNLKIDAVGDGGQAYGIAQWHPPRQANFAKVFGKDIRKSSFKDQLEFVDWELKNTESRAGNMLKSAKTPAEAASIVDQYYERSSGAHRQKRIDYAMALSSKSTKTA
jgi:peptidoglycan hydrolase-like protein with peptidoglycan-binding domain